MSVRGRARTGYAGGDTRLGPWIWRTRETIGRTIDQLTDEEDESWSQRAVRAPFVWYGRAFLRITNAISRRQEFAADAVAAREVGRDAHVEALRRVHALAPGFDVYWAEEVVPGAFAAGRRGGVGAACARPARREPHARPRPVGLARGGAARRTPERRLRRRPDRSVGRRGSSGRRGDADADLGQSEPEPAHAT